MGIIRRRTEPNADLGGPGGEKVTKFAFLKNLYHDSLFVGGICVLIWMAGDSLNIPPIWGLAAWLGWWAWQREDRRATHDKEVPEQDESFNGGIRAIAARVPIFLLVAVGVGMVGVRIDWLRDVNLGLSMFAGSIAARATHGPLRANLRSLIVIRSIPGLLLALASGTVSFRQWYLVGIQADPTVVAEYRFGSEGMLTHGGWHFATAELYAAIALIEGFAALAIVAAFTLAILKRSPRIMIAAYALLAIDYVINQKFIEGI